MAGFSASVFSLTLGFLFISSAVGELFNPHPQENPSFEIQQEAHQYSVMVDQKLGEDKAVGVGAGCLYTVKIKTSCSSPRYTRDYISIAFGDLYRNEVYIPRLDDPSSRTFESCSADTFDMQGPCGYGVCYLYLRRAGWDGWVPESVTIYERSYGRSVVFYYGTPLPNSVWYGFNNCPRAAVTAVVNSTETAGSRDV